MNTFEMSSTYFHTFEFPYLTLEGQGGYFAFFGIHIINLCGAKLQLFILSIRGGKCINVHDFCSHSVHPSRVNVQICQKECFETFIVF